MTAPERIWAASVTENYGEWQTTTDGLPRPTEYVRADLVMARIAALEAQLAEISSNTTKARQAVERLANTKMDMSLSEWSELSSAILSAIEATPPARADRLKDEPAAFLIERLAGSGYGRARKVIDAAIYDPRRDDFWIGDGKKNHLVTPLYALSALEATPPAPKVTATHRHKKRGSEYVLIGYGRMQAESWFEYDTGGSIDMREVAIYRSVDDGSLWVRPKEEFEDGRFETLTAAQEAGKP